MGAGNGSWQMGGGRELAKGVGYGSWQMGGLAKGGGMGGA